MQVKKTEFFRDERVLSALDQLVLPGYAEGREINMASVGCSTGQEPYSLLLRHWHERDRLKIDGFDIDPGNIAEAKSGEYEIFIATTHSELKKFGSLGLPHPEEAYLLGEGKSIAWAHISFTPEAKGKIKFAVHDILEAPLAEEYDVVLLQNVLFHYPEKEREHILINVSDSMNGGGWLVCESAPSVAEQDARRLDYRQWMKDISGWGFEKQTVILRDYLVKNQTSFSQIYRKSR